MAAHRLRDYVMMGAPDRRDGDGTAQARVRCEGIIGSVEGIHRIIEQGQSPCSVPGRTTIRLGAQEIGQGVAERRLRRPGPIVGSTALAEQRREMRSNRPIARLDNLDTDLHRQHRLGRTRR